MPGFKRTYDSAFGVATGRNVRIAPYPFGGYARNLNNNRRRRRGGRYSRRPFRGINPFTNPVYPIPQNKAFDYNLAATSIPNIGFVKTINIIGQNFTEPSRIGTQISTKSCFYSYVVNLGATTMPIACRVALVWDKQPNAATTAYNTIFAPDLGADADGTIAPINIAGNDRYTILAQDRFTLSPNGDQIRFITGFRKINMRTVFNDAENLEPITGALLLVACSNQATGANQPTIYGNWRTRFINC